MAARVSSATFGSAAEKIRDALDHLDAVGEGLDAWQSDMFARALACLQMGNHALAEDAVYRACRPKLFRSKAAAIGMSGGPVVSIAELKAELDRVAGGVIC